MTQPTALPSLPTADDTLDWITQARTLERIQTDPILTGLLSNSEMAARREIAEQHRAKDAVADVARTDRERDADSKIADMVLRHRIWHKRASLAQQRATSPEAQTAQLYQVATLAPRALIGVVAAGMTISAVNVQHVLTQGMSLADPMYWLSFLLEPLVSVPLIVVMMVTALAARRGHKVDRRKVAYIEAGLLAGMLALNVAPHIGGGDWRTMVYSAVGPIMVATSVALHPWVSGLFATLLTATHTDTPADLRATA